MTRDNWEIEYKLPNWDGWRHYITLYAEHLSPKEQLHRAMLLARQLTKSENTRMGVAVRVRNRLTGTMIMVGTSA